MPDYSLKKEKNVWLVAVDMGYGHLRTAYALKEISFQEKIINANNYPGIPEKDKKTWENSRRAYEFVSQFKSFPLIGRISFSLFDNLQKIQDFYPKKKHSSPNLMLRWIYFLIRKGWGRDLIEKLRKRPLPLISTFFIPAFMAEFYDYPGEIFCLLCDADIARTWAPLKPETSRIKYFASTERAVERLTLYGVKPENIFLTGYPLPLEIIGSDLEIVKSDLKKRIVNLDPQKRYLFQYRSLIREYLGELPQNSGRPLTIMFAVGGAGAQKEIGVKILKSFLEEIRKEKLKIILVAGSREEVKEYFFRKTRDFRLEKYLGQTIEIIFHPVKEFYFQQFNQALRKTDILWTKPSELSFFSALGLPIIIAPPIGSQEKFNQEWLLKIGSGIKQGKPEYAREWLLDLLNAGLLAEAAFQGFIEIEKSGSLNIKKIIKEVG